MAAPPGLENSTVVFALDGAQCWRVLGDEKELVDEGTLRVLAVQPPAPPPKPGQAPRAAPTAMHFLYCGRFSCPLTPKVPVLKFAGGRSYVFQMPGEVVLGVMLADSVSTDDVEIFESLLATHSLFRMLDNEVSDAASSSSSPAPAVSHPEDAAEEETALAVSSSSSSSSTGRTTRVAVGAMDRTGRGVETSSRRLAKAIVTGAAVTAVGVNRASAALKKRIKPAAEAKAVNPEWQARINKAKIGATVGLSVSKGMLEGMVSMAQSIGAGVAEAVGETGMGKKLKTDQAGPKTQAAKELSARAVVAVDTVWESLYDALKIVGGSMGTASHELLEHKYGEEVGRFAKDATVAAGKAGIAAMNVSKIGTKAIVSAAAKQAASDILREDRLRIEEEASQQHQLPAA